MKNDFLVVIPARMGSTRFPGKVLASLGGKPVVERCREAALAARIGPVVVATEEEAVARALEPFQAEVVMTSERCASGTDRVREAASRFLKSPRARARAGKTVRFVMNLQGDEPLIQPGTIRRVARLLREHRDTDIATAVVETRDSSSARDPNVVKAALGADGRCLYFSRAPIPWADASSNGSNSYFKHIGIYAYRLDALRRFVKLPPSPLEIRERLEQLRALEAGMTIRAAIVSDLTVAIDTPADLDRAAEVLRAQVLRTQALRASRKHQGASQHG